MSLYCKIYTFKSGFWISLLSFFLIFVVGYLNNRAISCRCSSLAEFCKHLSATAKISSQQFCRCLCAQYFLNININLLKQLNTFMAGSGIKLYQIWIILNIETKFEYYWIYKSIGWIRLCLWKTIDIFAFRLC